MRDRNTTPTALLTDLVIIVMIAMSLFLFGPAGSSSEPTVSTGRQIAVRANGLTPVAIEAPGRAVVSGIENGLHEDDAAGNEFE